MRLVAIIGRGSGSPSSSSAPGGARRDRQTRPDVVVRGDASVSRHHAVISYRSGGSLDAPGRFSLRVLGEKHALLAAAAAAKKRADAMQRQHRIEVQNKAIRRFVMNLNVQLVTHRRRVNSAVRSRR